MELSSSVRVGCFILLALSCPLWASRVVASELRGSGAMKPTTTEALQPTNASVSDDVVNADCKAVWNANLYENTDCGGNGGFNICTTTAVPCYNIFVSPFAVPYIRSVDALTVATCDACFYTTSTCVGNCVTIPKSTNKCWNLGIQAVSFSVVNC